MNVPPGTSSPVFTSSDREPATSHPSPEPPSGPWPSRTWSKELGRGLARLGLGLAGLALLLVGLLMDGPALARWVAGHVTPDGNLGPGTQAQVAAFRPLILGAGAIGLL
ncbi:MAG TPA: hypothetical protein VNM87_10870, partial [Candidatus Udaeobacter sp.]|nr:hypothetical protein [Candidatus Udaeobacter sp.]